MQAKKEKPVGVIYGGGQIPSANYVIGELIKKLLRMSIQVYAIHKSYMGLADSTCYEKIDDMLKACKIQKQIGTYLSTCRKVFPATDEWFDKIIMNLSKYGINTLFICGGDGSALGARDFQARCEEIGYKMKIIFIPCTIDGINGSLSIGLNSAVEESLRQTKMIAANSFATFDNKMRGARIAIVEIQGRNRNDIAVNVLKQIIADSSIAKFAISEINIKFLASGYKWSYTELINSVIATDMPTLILASEGAKPTEMWWDAISGDNISSKLTNLINATGIRKANCDVIGYLSQTNDFISSNEKNLIDMWTLKAIQEFERCLLSVGSTAIICDTDKKLKAVPLSYITELNPNCKEPAIISIEDLITLKPYM